MRSEKDKYSVQALIENNVIKAKKLLDLLAEYPPKHFFCVSTDKAANPVNIMGASKRIMEDMIMAYTSKFKVTTARFANVAFSNGSLLAGFIDRIMKQQPLAAPCDVRRYFVNFTNPGQHTSQALYATLLALDAKQQSAAPPDPYRYEQRIDGRRSYLGCLIPDNAPPRPDNAAFWNETTNSWRS